MGEERDTIYGNTDPLSSGGESDVQVDEEDGGEEEVVDDEEGQSGLDFEGGMNPLDFVQQDDAGEGGNDDDDDAYRDKLYQQLERMDQECEVLAERKRKLLPDDQCEGSTKRPRQDDNYEVFQEEVWKFMSHGRRKRRDHIRKKGRRMGSKNKLSPEVTRKLGDATLHYAHGRYEEAITLLLDVVHQAPDLPDPYHTLALVYSAMSNKKKATNCYMLAAYLSPRDSSLWKHCLTLSIDLGYRGQAWYCLEKAIKADPTDTALRYHRASHFLEIKDYKKAAESYEQIVRLNPTDVEALKKALKLYKESGLPEHSVMLLENYVNEHPPASKLSTVDMLASLCMENNDHAKALAHIENVKKLNPVGNEFLLSLTTKEGICHLHLGNMDKAEICFSLLLQENAKAHVDLITEVANSFMDLQLYESALKYYLIVDGFVSDKVSLYSRVAQCYIALKKRSLAIQSFYKALQADKDNIDTRITLASLLIEEQRDDEAIALLSTPCDDGLPVGLNGDRPGPWWESSPVKLKLSHIYKAKGMLDGFVDTVFPLVHESLLYMQHYRVRRRKRLSKSTLSARVKVLDDQQSEAVFQKYREPSSRSDSCKALRAKKSLAKIAAEKEEKKSAALAAGLDWESDDSDEDAPLQPPRTAPLPDLLKDEDQFCLIKDLCNSLMSLGRYGEALKLLSLTLRLSCKILPTEKKEELRHIGAQIALKVTDPSDAFDYIRYIVLQNPGSVSAWNCYYKLSLRLENRQSKHQKFLHHMRVRKGLVHPILISGNQLTMISQHQAAAREYLEAYKLMPENPLINLCVGTALINLALGHRIQNKHQCVAQGLTFLWSNLRLCENSQEPLYNIARACHHVGLVSLAASYYEKVLAIHEKDCPLPKSLEEDMNVKNPKSGYCDLRREAAYNLHLIYKKSGAIDLARQVLKDYCSDM